ncbi:hypothetical protein EDB89DRAFT_1614721 [Lactarius sanguifluus]|nr:hypothetical protein EDB89DRAFT_1614721 [Lactarius sanguifluus]
MASIGPQLPAHSPSSDSVAQRPPQTDLRSSGAPVLRYEEEEEEDEDSYTPELPPELAAARASTSAPSRRTLGPARGPLRREEEEEESEDDVGPLPPPPPHAGAGPPNAHEDAVAEFIQKEAQRRQAVEEAARPKTLQRPEWMLVPPSSSDLLSTLDPTKLNKPRQFSRSTAPARVVDNTLWTETPAERQQRLADEVMGKKRRVENADLADLDPHAEEDANKRRKRDAELQRQVGEFTRKHRGSSLIDAHAREEAKRKKDAQEEESSAIWDHSRDMALGGRLMDEKDRRRIIQDAKGLSERFGESKSGNFL